MLFIVYVKVLLMHNNLWGLFLLCPFISKNIHLLGNEFCNDGHNYEYGIMVVIVHFRVMMCLVVNLTL